MHFYKCAELASTIPPPTQPPHNTSSVHEVPEHHRPANEADFFPQAITIVSTNDPVAILTCNPTSALGFCPREPMDWRKILRSVVNPKCLPHHSDNNHAREWWPAWLNVQEVKHRHPPASLLQTRQLVPLPMSALRIDPAQQSDVRQSIIHCPQPRIMSSLPQIQERERQRTADLARLRRENGELGSRVAQLEQELAAALAGGSQPRSPARKRATPARGGGPGSRGGRQGRGRSGTRSARGR